MVSPHLLDRFALRLNGQVVKTTDRTVSLLEVLDDRRLGKETQPKPLPTEISDRLRKSLQVYPKITAKAIARIFDYTLELEVYSPRREIALARLSLAYAQLRGAYRLSPDHVDTAAGMIGLKKGIKLTRKSPSSTLEAQPELLKPAEPPSTLTLSLSEQLEPSTQEEPVYESEEPEVVDISVIFNTESVNPYPEDEATVEREAASLRFYENGADEYSVWGGNALKILPQTEPNQSPHLSLGKLVQKGEVPENIQDAMSVFSHINVAIRKWLKELKLHVGEQLCLVITDYTDFEIPWEMLELSPYESPNEYLGALITTVRWRQIIRGDDYVVLEFKADECCGNAVAYVLDSELDGVGPELDILEQLQAVIYRSKKHEIKEFQTHLQRNDAGYGFVYISCHGTFRSDLREFALGSDSDEQQQLKLLALRKCQLNLVKNSQGIVFINACHSGREQAHSSVPHSYRMGFIELFLAKGARGVIGTLGAVGDTHAAKFAHDLIHESLQSPNLSIATLLRELRLRVVENLPEQPTTKDLLPFIYTFMYVYYGNPMTVLRLTPPGGQANV